MASVAAALVAVAADRRSRSHRFHRRSPRQKRRRRSKFSTHSPPPTLHIISGTIMLLVVAQQIDAINDWRYNMRPSTVAATALSGRSFDIDSGGDEDGGMLDRAPYTRAYQLPTPVDAELESFTAKLLRSSTISSAEEEEGVLLAQNTQQHKPSTAVHNLCSSERSGGQSDDLSWSEPANRLFLALRGTAPISAPAVDEEGLREQQQPSVGRRYNRYMAPSQWEGTTTNVSIAFFIESMSSFKAQTMDYEVDMYFAMSWFDRRLSHNCTHPILITHKHIAESLWSPDLYFLNSKFAYLQEVITPNFMMVVYPDGLVFKSLRVDLTLSCMMDLKLYPFDKQECPFIIQSYAYVEQLVRLNWHVDPPLYPIALNPNLRLNDMEIVNTRYETCTSSYTLFRGTGNWSCVQGYIVMNRLVLFHLIQTFLPSGMLVSISWITFWLDPRASPARVTLTITSLLTLTTMGNGARQDLPQVSYIKAMDIWQSFSQALIFLVLLEYSFVSFYTSRRLHDCEHRRNRRKSTIRKSTIRLDRERSVRLMSHLQTPPPAHPPIFHPDRPGEHRQKQQQNNTHHNSSSNNLLPNATTTTIGNSRIGGGGVVGEPHHAAPPPPPPQIALLGVDSPTSGDDAGGDAGNGSGSVRRLCRSASSFSWSVRGSLMSSFRAVAKRKHSPSVHKPSSSAADKDRDKQRGERDEKERSPGWRRRGIRGRFRDTLSRHDVDALFAAGIGADDPMAAYADDDDFKPPTACLRYSRVVFPVIFAMFCAFYWLYFMWIARMDAD